MTPAQHQVLDRGPHFGGLTLPMLWDAYKHVPALRELMQAHADYLTTQKTDCVSKSLSHWGMQQVPPSQGDSPVTAQDLTSFQPPVGFDTPPIRE